MKSLIRSIARRLGYYIGEFPPAADRHAAHLRALIAAKDVDLVIDVGAHFGEYGQWLREEVGYIGPIVSFEPVPAHVARLEQVARADRGNWRVHAVALGAVHAESPINVLAGGEGQMASFHAPSVYASTTLGPRVTVTERPVVSVRRLDDLDVGGSRVFLKLDTQGHDLAVLEGARDTLTRVVAMQSEVSVTPLYEDVPTIRDSLATLEQLGFTLSAAYTVALDQQFRAQEMDVVLVRAAR